MTTTSIAFKSGDQIQWCDEIYTVIENYGRSGKVKDASGDTIDNFYWCIYGEQARLQSSAKATT